MTTSGTVARRRIVWALAGLVAVGAVSASAWWWLVERPVRAVRAAYEAGEWSQAYRLAEAYLNSRPSRSEVQLVAARSAAHLEFWSFAEKYYSQVPARSLEDLRLRASAAIALEQWTRASELLEQIVELAPDDAEALMKLAAVRYKDGHDVEATEMAEHAVDLLADTPMAARAYSRLGALQSERGNRFAAIENLRRALELDPAGKTLFRPLHVIRLDLAENLILTGSAAEAQVELERVLADKRSNRIRVLYELGRARLLQGDPEGAEQYWQQVLEQDEKHVGSLVALGEQALIRNQVDVALEYLEAAVRYEPQSSHAHYVYGRALVQAGRTEAGRSEYEMGKTLRENLERAVLENRALFKRPDSPEMRVHLAKREAARGNWPQAEQWAREAAQLAPDDPRYARFLELVRTRQLPADEVPR